MSFLPANPSEAFKRRNPHLYTVDKLETRKPKSASVQALDNRLPKRKKGESGLEIIVTIISIRKRLLDDDNAIAACKPLRDSIAAELILDDDDTRIKFEYGQIQSTGKEGCLVKIEKI